MVATVGPVLKVVIDGGRSVGERSPVFADLALYSAGQGGEFSEDFGAVSGCFLGVSVHM